MDEGSDKEEKVLPLFRRDLKLYRGPDDASGAPTYSLYDPVTAHYYRVSWEESLVFKYLRPGMRASDLIKEIEKTTPVKVTVQQLERFFEDAMRHHLLEGYRPSDDVLREVEARRLSPLKWLLTHYLYVRIPLINPDHFLERTLSWVRPLVSRGALFLYCVLGLMGLVQLVLHFDEFVHTFPYFFNLRGVLAYALAITAVKFIHEFSHAYVAKSYHVRVPSMGVAFLVFWPVLYTDVTDSWKLRKRSERLAITCAGVISELIIAALCTLSWTLSEPGIWQSIFFVVASATWISSLAVNLNPAMRFDGYYLLSDLWGIDNLQLRAFAMARWQLRRWLLGLEVPAPETGISRRYVIGMVAYSIYTWVYRIFLYTAIAIFVYLKFTKVLGIFLLATEVVLFIARPVVSEFRQIYHLRSLLKTNVRMLVTASIVGVLILWLVLPLPRSHSFPAVTVAMEHQVLYVPHDGVVEAIFVQRDDEVVVGQPMMKMTSKGLENEIASKQVERAILKKQVQIFTESDELRSLIPEKEAEISALEAELAGLLELQEQLTLRAQVAGLVYMWDDTLQPGQAIAVDHVVGKIASTKKLEVIGFVPEEYVTILKEGKMVKFRSSGSFTELEGFVKQVSPSRAEVLQYAQLASINQGDIPVVEEVSSNELRIVESYYSFYVELQAEETPLRLGQTGTVELRGPPQSRLVQFLRYASSLFWRESGF